MSNILDKQTETSLRNIVASAIVDYQDEAKSHMDYWSTNDEDECRKQVCDECVEIVKDERRGMISGKTGRLLEHLTEMIKKTSPDKSNDEITNILKRCKIEIRELM